MATVRVFKHHIHSSFYWLALVDTLLFVLAFYVGTYVYFFFAPSGYDHFLPQVAGRAALFSMVTMVCLFAMGLYEPRMREGASGILLRTAGAFLATTMVMSAIFYLLPDLHIWRGIFIYTLLAAFSANLISRRVFSGMTKLEQFKSRVLVLGSGPAACTFDSAMRRATDRQGFQIVGYVRCGDEEPRTGGARVINLNQPLHEYVKQTEIDQIVVALDDKRALLPADELFQCRQQGVKVYDLLSFFEREAGKILVDFVTPGWMTFSDGFHSSKPSKLFKRCSDVLASFLLLIFLWPIMLLTMLAIWLEDGFKAPVFFHQVRVGLHGKTFKVLKFRSMSVNAESDGKARWATTDDCRVTRVGRFIRATRIDELPQIINVLSGDMSFVGPRPSGLSLSNSLPKASPTTTPGIA